jgi:hypothetical protein
LLDFYQPDTPSNKVNYQEVTKRKGNQKSSAAKAASHSSIVAQKDTQRGSLRNNSSSNGNMTIRSDGSSDGVATV